MVSSEVALSHYIAHMEMFITYEFLPTTACNARVKIYRTAQRNLI